jgi:hypothetical protein
LLSHKHISLLLRLPVETNINEIKRLSHCPDRPKSWHEPCMKGSKRNSFGRAVAKQPAPRFKSS